MNPSNLGEILPAPYCGPPRELPCQSPGGTRSLRVEKLLPGLCPPDSATTFKARGEETTSLAGAWCHRALWLQEAVGIGIGVSHRGWAQQHQGCGKPRPPPQAVLGKRVFLLCETKSLNNIVEDASRNNPNLSILSFFSVLTSIYAAAYLKFTLGKQLMPVCR